jgi:hypothetical protein
LGTGTTTGGTCEIIRVCPPYPIVLLFFDRKREYDPSYKIPPHHQHPAITQLYSFRRPGYRKEYADSGASPLDESARLKPTQERKLADRPEELIDIVQSARQQNPDLNVVFIDEVQKIPALLDVVHHLIESTPLLFALTDSSARKLKRSGANLLAGRAFVYHLFPLTSGKMGSRFSLNDTLTSTSIP